jgi:hypothetical protein
VGHEVAEGTESRFAGVAFRFVFSKVDDAPAILVRTDRLRDAGNGLPPQTVLLISVLISFRQKLKTILRFVDDVSAVTDRTLDLLARFHLVKDVVVQTLLTEHVPTSLQLLQLGSWEVLQTD